MTPDELRERLTTWLRQHRGDPSIEVDDLRRLTGGASRETWALRVGDERMILQRERAGSDRPGGMALEGQILAAAAAARVPVAPLHGSGADDPLLGSFLLSAFVDGETIARKILRDDAYADARTHLAADCGDALARLHAIPLESLPELSELDQVKQYRDVLDQTGDPHPAFELAFRWLEAHRPPASGRTLVHGDFRLGNLMVGPDGLRAVIDWELAHLGDPMEDLGWLCTKAWRFGAKPPVAGLGEYEELFEAYAAASGRPVDAAVVRWWEVLGTLKWGVMCIMQARAHLDGWSRSMELAAIGRRVCENEHDLLLLLAPDSVAAAWADEPGAPPPPPWLHGRPTAAELAEAVREWVVADVRSGADARVGFHSRVAENVLRTLEREITMGPVLLQRHAARLATLGVEDEHALAAAIRAGTLEDRLDEVHAVVAGTVVDKLRVANPTY